MSEQSEHTCQVFHFDLYGTREEKYDYLRTHSLHDVEWQQLEPQAPSFFFVPKDFSLQEEYNKGFRIDELMKVGACGIVTSRDSLLIRNTPQELEQVRKDFENLSEEEFRRKYEIKDNSDWTYSGAKENIKYTTIIPVSYRPFDDRYVLYTSKKGVISRPRFDIMRHLLNGYYRDSIGIVKGCNNSSRKLGEVPERRRSVSEEPTHAPLPPSNLEGESLRYPCTTDALPLNKGNIALNVCKQQSTFDFQHVLVSKNITDKCTLSAQTKEAGYVFPLYLYPEEGSIDTERRVNMDAAIMERIAACAIRGAGVPPAEANDRERDAHAQGDTASGTLAPMVTPTNVFDYIYGILHSPSYREKYKEFLKVDFPRIPYPKDAQEFEHYRYYGEQLRRLHLMENIPNNTSVSFPVAGNMVVEQFAYTAGGQSASRVYINATQYFDNVPRVAWEMYIGGYQPAQKWLQTRKGMTLDFKDVKHYQSIIYVLLQTARIMQEIDNNAKHQIV